MTRIAKHAKQVSASIPTIRRLPSYLQVVRQYRDEGREVISGTVIAEELELEAIQVRKDLAVTGIVGKPRVGYPVDDLITAIRKFLGWDKPSRVVVVGTGNLGSALMDYQELKNHGLTLVAGFDISPKRIGVSKSGVPVHHLDKLGDVVSREGATLAILTVPSESAQEVCDDLVEAGIRHIWNFTNVKLRVPDDVLVLKEDLSSGFAVLTVLRHV